MPDTFTSEAMADFCEACRAVVRTNNDQHGSWCEHCGGPAKTIMLWTPELANADKILRSALIEGKALESMVEQHMRLIQALTYPRYGDTAKLLEKAADDIEKYTNRDGWTSYFTPHLRRAAKRIREALAFVRERRSLKKPDPSKN